MKSWKTTLAGFGFGVLNLFIANMSGGIKPKDALISAALVTVGAFAKDYDKTNAARPVMTQPSNVDVLVDIPKSDPPSFPTTR